ncbi:LLM class flavin-dependent oxidoreductase [SAR202 cluster bacterium AD-802-E10_MRT_200m]|nr:LLM class flavin-dependent oxidoreductase [SAR202 cluster bacterium AD-802-E10_MRT_200m]
MNLQNVKFGASFRPDSPQDVKHWATTAENLGYTRANIADSSAIYRELWVSVTVAAMNTNTVITGPWVTNPVTRHPVITASSAATVDELAPGRVSIGIATGDSAIYNLGRKAATINDLREYILAVQELLETGTAEYKGRQVKLPWAKKHIPIYVAAHGSKSLFLAGEVGDGVIVGTGNSRDVVEQSLAVLDKGARSRGRTVDDLDIWWAAGYNASDDSEESEPARGGYATAAHFLSRHTLEGKFIPDKYKAGIKKLGDSYDMTTHGKNVAEQQKYYQQIAEEAGVADYLAERFGCFTGNVEQCLAKLNEMVSMGITQFTSSIPGPDRPKHLQKWHDLIMREIQ